MQIVKSVRNDNKVRQEVLRHVGTATSEEKLRQLKQLGRLIIEEIRQSESTPSHLFSPKQFTTLIEQNRHARNRPVPPSVRLANCREESRICVGVREVMGEMYRLLGWQRLLGARRMSANRIIEELVLARIAQPLSKRATVAELERFGDVSLNLDQVYKSMDYLTSEVIEKIVARSHQMAQKLYPEPITVIFYDTTTLYFESEVIDELRAKGYSKDGKHNRVQVVFALLITREGMPLGYELFPGNIYKGHTLIESLQGLQQRHPNCRFTLVADAAMISKENEKLMQEHKIRYILGARLKSQGKSFKEQILCLDDFLAWDDSRAFSDWMDSDPNQITRYKSLRKNGTRVIVTYSSKRARKDLRRRKEGVDQLRTRLSKSSRPKAVSQRGYARFLDFPKGQVAINADKVEAAARWDGLSGIVAWGHDDADARELVLQYRRLWQIEACFRSNKHDLKIHPIFHWAELARARSHCNLLHGILLPAACAPSLARARICHECRSHPAGTEFLADQHFDRAEDATKICGAEPRAHRCQADLSKCRPALERHSVCSRSEGSEGRL